MKNKNARTIVIVVLCCLLVFMSIGFALLSQRLNINGTTTVTNTWAVLIESITPIENNTGARSTESLVKPDKVSASFKVEFQKPGDYMEYEIVVANRGSIDAVLKSVESSIEPSADKELYTFDYTEAPQGQTLTAGTTTTFKIRVTYNSNANRIPTVDASFDLKLNYEQVSSPGGAVTPNVSWEYDITESGELIAYNYETGNTAVVPATVNGIPVKKITSQSFTQNNVKFYVDNSTGLANGVIYEEDSTDFESVKEKGILILAAQQCGGGDACVNQIRNMVNFAKPGEISFPADAAIQTVYIDPDASLSWDQSVGNGNEVKVEKLDLSNAIYLEEIGDTAFSEAPLNEVVFPEDGVLTTIGKSAFYCTDLENVKIPTSVETIEQNAFGGDDHEHPSLTLKSLIFGENSKLKKIGNSAFIRNELTQLQLPNSITEIGERAFASNKLTGLKLPSNLTNISAYCFYNNNLKSIDLPDSIRQIGEDAFSANELSTIVIPSNVEKIEKWAFSNQADSNNNRTLTSIFIERTEADFLANVSVPTDGFSWYDQSLNPTINYK